MIFFKTIDEKLNDIGFIKMDETKYGVKYQRVNNECNYIQCLDLLHKASGKHLIQSYQKDLNKDGFNNMIGLTIYESKLAVRKMKQMGYKEIR